MRFVLTDEFWALDALTPAEWHLVAELPATAAGESFSQSTRERLFPSPFAPDALLDEDTFSHLEDWQQFVKPDIETEFENSRALVQRDLDGVELFAASEMLEPEYSEIGGELSELRRLRVPLEHTDSWYSALNQARLLMNEEFNLAASEDRILLQMETPEQLDQSRILLLAQYELYSAVQSILVENVMIL